MRRNSEKKRILVVDDDTAILDAVKCMLEIADYDVETEANGKIIDKIKTEKPDLLLLDIWMSGVDGRDICKQLKADGETNCIPVILISASRDIEKSVQIAKADDYLEKPFEMDTLLEKVAQYVS